MIRREYTPLWTLCRRLHHTVASLLICPLGLLLFIGLLAPAPLAAYEFAEIGAGGAVSYAFPLGWFDDRKLSSNYGLEAHVTYSLDEFIPDLSARLALSYQTFDGTRSAGYKYGFSDISLYLNGIYYYDLGLPMKPYVLAGIGLDQHRIEWSYEEPGYSTSHSRSGLGLGLIVGGGGLAKPTDYIGVFAEMSLQSSTWVAGPGFLDFILRMTVGVTFYIHL